ncbi:Protease HtpX [uncultured archaeon]|nr:Protease HtpX [uncultured archaeon]
MAWNMLKTTFLMALLMGVVIAAFTLVGGKNYAFMGLIVGGLMNILTYWFSDRIVLAMTHAQPADPAQYKQLNEIVEKVARKANIPTPKAYIVNDPTLNAFATGRGPGHAAIVVHTGLLSACTAQEVEGVIGHELTHVKNRDVLISTIAAVMAGVLSYLGYAFMWNRSDREDRGGNALALVAVILAPIAGMLIQLAISRSREYAADEGGAQLTNPQWLASALEKIDSNVRTHPKQGNPSTAHMYIANPFGGTNFINLFSTHPPAKERIKRLHEMPGGGGSATLMR